METPAHFKSNYNWKNLELPMIDILNDIKIDLIPITFMGVK